MKKLLYAMTHFFLNSIVCHLPGWTVRKCFYKAFGLKIGKKAMIRPRTVLINPWGITIGDRTVINTACHLDGRGGLAIGRDTSISSYTIILTASHDIHAADFTYIRRKTTIGDRVFVGMRSIILDGAGVGDECVIGAGSTFRGKGEPGWLYSGVPAVKIKQRELNGPYQLG